MQMIHNRPECCVRLHSVESNAGHERLKCILPTSNASCLDLTSIIRRRDSCAAVPDILPPMPDFSCTSAGVKKRRVLEEIVLITKGIAWFDRDMVGNRFVSIGCQKKSIVGWLMALWNFRVDGSHRVFFASGFLLVLRLVIFSTGLLYLVVCTSKELSFTRVKNKVIK